MPSQLIALDKLTRVSRVGIRETWRQRFAKCVLKVTLPEATHVCKDENICAVLKAGIYWKVQRFQSIWDTNSTKENCSFLRVDVNNAFKEINQIIMLWTVCHLWPSVSHFVLNCYHHHL